MSDFKNTPQKTDEVTTALRGLCAKRATTMCFMMDEAAKEGAKGEDWARRAIREYGVVAGKDMRAVIRNPADMNEFAQHFAASQYDRDIYEMETVAQDGDKYYIDFHYCPYVEQWEKLGRSKEDIALLCDIAMDGDRGVADCFDDIEFSLPDTIAQGGMVCKIRFDKKK